MLDDIVDWIRARVVAWTYFRARATWRNHVRLTKRVKQLTTTRRGRAWTFEARRETKEKGSI